MGVPLIRIKSVRKVYDDGQHNAFTDLCSFENRLYLSFRSCPDGHGVFPTSKIVLLESQDDALSWGEVFEFSVPNRDTRDPHFLLFRETLFVYSGAWVCDPARPGVLDLNDHLGFAVRSTDGGDWNGPRMLEGTYGHYIWRVNSFGGKAYLCGRRKRNFTSGARGETDRRLSNPLSSKAMTGLYGVSVPSSLKTTVMRPLSFLKKMALSWQSFVDRERLHRDSAPRSHLICNGSGQTSVST